MHVNKCSPDLCLLDDYLPVSEFELASITYELAYTVLELAFTV